MSSVVSSLPPLSSRGQSLMARAAEELRSDARDGIHKGCVSARGGPGGLSLDLDAAKNFGIHTPQSARERNLSHGVSLVRQKDVLASGQQHLTCAAAHGHRRGTHAGARDFTDPDEEELRGVCQQIGIKAAQKFSTVREAFRYLDADRDGKISRSEIQYFFRAYNIYGPVVDRFFDKLDHDNSGEVDYTEFAKYIVSYIQSDNGCTESGSPDGGISEASTRTPSPSDGNEGTRAMDEDLRTTLAFIGMKSKEKFSHAREVFRAVDCNDDGRISRKELRYFYRVFNLSDEKADKLFNFMAGNASDISYYDFVKVVGPFLELPGVQAAMLQKPSGPKPSNRPSRRSSIANSTSRPSSVPSVVDGSAPPASTLGDDSGSVSGTSSSQFLASLPGDQDLEKELRDVMKDIRVKLPLKFKHVRDAFRCLDLNHNGKITRTELRSFLRGFGWSASVADRMFSALDEESSGEIDFNVFMSYFDEVLGPANRPAYRTDLLAVDDATLRDDVNHLAGVLGDKLLTKFTNARQAFATLDLSNNGRISHSDMRRFFRTMCMPVKQADKLFRALCQDGEDYVDYDDFLSLFGHEGKVGSRWRAVEELKGIPKPTIWKMM